MNRKEAKTILLEQGRFVISVEHAEEICNAFKLELDKSLIRTTRGYRENVLDETEPRVSISSLSEFVCKKLEKEPNKEKLKVANSMLGEGSYHDLFSEAHAINL